MKLLPSSGAPAPSLAGDLPATASSPAGAGTVEAGGTVEQDSDADRSDVYVCS